VASLTQSSASNDSAMEKASTLAVYFSFSSRSRSCKLTEVGVEGIRSLLGSAASLGVTPHTSPALYA
jgi:hypothetical protein